MTPTPSAKVMNFEPTPNPNALKCVLDRPVLAEGKIKSYFNAEQAVGDPLAETLFAIPGITNLLITHEWVTINKAPDAKWPAIKKAVRTVLTTAPSP